MSMHPRFIPVGELANQPGGVSFVATEKGTEYHCSPVSQVSPSSCEQSEHPKLARDPDWVA